MLIFEACRHEGKWAVFNRVSHSFEFVGCGRTFCERNAKELNALAERERWPRPVWDHLHCD